MHLAETNLAKWNQRIRRAEDLAAAHPAVASILSFYERVAKCQKELYWYLEESSARDLGALAAKAPEFLAEIAAAAPGPIAESAREWKTRDVKELLELYQSSASSGCSPGALLAWLVLSPYFEHLANQWSDVPETGASRLCPFCGRKPVVGVLRPEGDGAKRSLICSMCGAEWRFGRIMCAACGEETPDKLPVYSAEEFPQVRVEACNACGCYIKTVDLTKNGHAVPIVDELATVPLNLWAEEHGYVKLQPNMIGL
jgi:FdhE protein